MAQSLEVATQEIKTMARTMLVQAQERANTLGPHYQALSQALQTIQETMRLAAEPVEHVSASLTKVADNYEDVIGQDLFGGVSDGSKSGLGTAAGVIAAGALTYGAGQMGNVGSRLPGGTANSGERNGERPFSPATQSEHKTFVANHDEAVSAVQTDVMAGSGETVSRERAAEMLGAVQYFSGNTGSTPIRKAYNNPKASSQDVSAMKALDDYIRRAPKWKGKIYRGINVTRKQAKKIASGEFVDMLGPASWSSELGVAERFSKGYENTRIVFILGENKSGASIAHIGTYDGIESEVTSPSGVKYYIDRVSKVSHDGSEITFIEVHE